MKKLDYLKLALQHKMFQYRAWIITAFSITKPKDPDQSYPYQLVVRPWGYSFIDEVTGEVKIEDSKPDEPLFRFKDVIKIDGSWIDSLKEPIETTVGRLLFNHFCLMTGFGPKFPYYNKRTSVTDLEDIIAEKLKSTPEKEEDRSDKYFYVDEYINFVNALQDFSTLSTLASWSATQKSVIPPTGIEKFKADLLKKYEGKLDDPVEVAKLEKELLAYDDEFLKDDPAYGTFLSGKVKDTARKKLYLTMGNEFGFGSGIKSNTIVNSLDEGWPTDPKSFAILMNGSRVGSFARGAETVKGGVSAKYLLRAANNFVIVDGDCGSKIGLMRYYSDHNFQQLVGRYLVDGQKPTLVENKEQAGTYIGKFLKVRSPMYCKSPGDTICSVCAGQRLSQFKTGITIPLTEISAIILTASLKMMHTSGTSTAKLKLSESLT